MNEWSASIRREARAGRFKKDITDEQSWNGSLARYYCRQKHINYIVEVAGAEIFPGCGREREISTNDLKQTYQLLYKFNYYVFDFIKARGVQVLHPPSRSAYAAVAQITLLTRHSTVYRFDTYIYNIYTGSRVGALRGALRSACFAIKNEYLIAKIKYQRLGQECGLKNKYTNSINAHYYTVRLKQRSLQ